MNTSSGIRLNKFISDSGFCSRREADKFIEQQKVTINGIIPELGTKVLPGDEVMVNNKRIDKVPESKVDRVYIAYNKPIGITCTTARNVRGNIVEAIGHPKRIFPIGRLDKPSEGLIFLTSDGDIVNKILRAGNNHEKEYLVTVDRPITPKFVELMSNGIPILDTVTKPCVVERQSKFVFKIILTQGLNRQIRRMCEYLGFEVTKLKRIRIMNVRLGTLKLGEWRELTAQEMDDINAAVVDSKSTFEPDAAFSEEGIGNGDVKSAASDAAKQNLSSGKISFAKPKPAARSGRGGQRSFSKEGQRQGGQRKDGERSPSSRQDGGRKDSDRKENGRKENARSDDARRNGRRDDNRSERPKKDAPRNEGRPRGDDTRPTGSNNGDSRKQRPRPSGRPQNDRSHGSRNEGSRKEGGRSGGAPSGRKPKERR
ncbi:23S rRNA pseudouridine(2604) synthase RluF [Enterovibrio sp. ZSDZ42]|uniref:Pseudouridine synthase n=1 Tax=Enterovibrio gelatinilyticus TaxID=2899819 RepID=A0ABT5R174_9GAMM|nr:23S rRNA pseudouridine(2604) synthase RluF [Enterovibrio sp. ZSDZ42]MDD1794030.1 23S rRNA pseudouridine(2604) synthase RluF [Enterovibrio sp. ZSDZ42]